MFVITIFGLFLYLEVGHGLLQKEADCRTLSGGPYYFKKIGDTAYQCVKDGPEYNCPNFWVIPLWYTYGSTDPCVCVEVPGFPSSRVCPLDPMGDQRTTENPLHSVPVEGTIGDSGCPSPFQRFDTTLRIFNDSDPMAKEFVLDRELGFLTPENECKYHCLSLGSCAGVTYSEQNGEPKCTGFFAHSISYDFRGSEFHTYFEKLWCVASGKPILPTPPPLQDGLLLQNTQQTYGRSKVIFAGVAEMSCYAWCYYENSCQAVNYNKVTFECIYFEETDCSVHEPTLDHCCNHYKKKVNQCP